MLRIALIAFVLLIAPASSMAKRSKKPTLAVLYFDNNSGDPSLDDLSKGFADMLITDLSSAGVVQVVEREKLQVLIDEVKLQRTRFFDQKTAVKIGRGLGARYVVSGSFLEVTPRMRIDVRMIDVASSDVVLASQVEGRGEDVFALEQRLAGDFLLKLNHKFFAPRLPSTKVPNLEALLSYSEGLSLIDKGKDASAAAVMKALMTKAPAFGLARSRHADLLKRLASSSENRKVVLDQSAKELFAEAHAFLKAHKTSELSEEQAKHYLAYRVLVGREITAALHPVLQGRRDERRAVPRKGAGPALALMRSLYANQRLLISETAELSARFGSLSARLPRATESVARQLDMDSRDSSPSETMLRYLLQGRVPSAGSLPLMWMVPAPADLDPKLKRAAFTLAKARLGLKSPPGRPPLDAHQSRVLESLALWHITRGRVEKGILEYQKILDRFPKLYRWAFFEKQIQKQLGLEHDHRVKQLQKFQKGLSTCEPWDYNVGLRDALAQRISWMGLRAIDMTHNELQRTCKGSAKLPKMKKIFYLGAFLAAASYQDCELFERDLKRWLAQGGSSRDAAGYRKNYSNCR
ncbi:MAG: hypothetical protein GY811_18985 [Myxococcales bacterium]|nr:hypothetical protein [Myxococcales bacterium]